MPSYKVKIEIKFKPGVLDPQGETIRNALLNLNYSGVESVTTGKLFKVDLEAKSAKEAVATAKSLADKLLANPVIEDYTAEIEK
jgi:phosphoribosylformylglycinamidine synthase subunit PurS